MRAADAADVCGRLESRRGDRAARCRRAPISRPTSKVSNLANLSREGLGFGGNPQVPGGGAGRQRCRRRRAPMPGVDRNYSLNELIVAHGGLTPLLYAVRQGYVESTEALLKAGADVNHVSAGDETSPLLMAIINGHFDVAKILLERGADPNARASTACRRSTACSTSSGRRRRCIRSRSAHKQQKTRLSRADEDADRQGRRCQRADEDEGVVLGLQLRSVGRRRNRRQRVLARRLRQRRRGDAAAGRRRRGSEHADHQAGRPRALRRHARDARSRSISRACRRCRSAVRR